MVSLRINLPPLTRVLLVLLIGFSLVYQAASWRARQEKQTNTSVPWLALIPVQSVFFPWTFVTSSLAEGNLITLSIAGTTVFLGGRYLERAWGSSEFGKFLLVSTLVPNILATIYYIFLFAITRADSLAYKSFNGSIAIQAAFLVAFKQLVPEHTVTILKGFIKIRVKHFPAIFLTANTLSGFIFYTDAAAVLCWLGFLSSWTYLRFYKKQPDFAETSTGGATLRGDASETFAFAYFFPDAVQPPIRAVSENVYNLLVTLKLCTPFSVEEIQLGNDQANARGEGRLPSLLNQGSRRAGGGKREEAERRRALALKALDQRLQAATANRQQPAPSHPVPTTIAAPESSQATETATGAKDDSNMV